MISEPVILVSQKDDPVRRCLPNPLPENITDVNCAICARACLVNRENFTKGQVAVCVPCAVIVSRVYERSVRRAMAVLEHFLEQIFERV